MSQTTRRPKGNERRQQRIKDAKQARRNRQFVWIGASVAAVVLVVGFLASRPAPEGAATVEGQASLGAPAPTVEMVSFDGETVALADYAIAGTPVVLNFWASWCPFCIAEMPDFEDSSNALDGQVAFIGVNLQDDAGLAGGLVGETGVTYELTRDPQGVVYTAFGGIGMPTTVFIDADGIVREVATGQLSRAALDSKIDEYFNLSA